MIPHKSVPTKRPGPVFERVTPVLFLDNLHYHSIHSGLRESESELLHVEIVSDELLFFLSCENSRRFGTAPLITASRKVCGARPYSRATRRILHYFSELAFWTSRKSRAARMD